MDVGRKERHETKFASEQGSDPVSVTYEERGDDTEAFNVRVNGDTLMLMGEEMTRALHACLSYALEEANPGEKAGPDNLPGPDAFREAYEIQ